MPSEDEMTRHMYKPPGNARLSKKQLKAYHDLKYDLYWLHQNYTYQHSPFIFFQENPCHRIVPSLVNLDPKTDRKKEAYPLWKSIVKPVSRKYKTMHLEETLTDFVHYCYGLFPTEIPAHLDQVIECRHKRQDEPELVSTALKLFHGEEPITGNFHKRLLQIVPPEFKKHLPTIPEGRKPPKWDRFVEYAASCVIMLEYRDFFLSVSWIPKFFDFVSELENPEFDGITRDAVKWGRKRSQPRSVFNEAAGGRLFRG